MLKTLPIGLDTACWSVLGPLIEDGDPLQDTHRTGVGVELESRIPPSIASTWPPIYTGMTPDKHGVFYFVSFEGYRLPGRQRDRR